MTQRPWMIAGAVAAMMAAAPLTARAQFGPLPATTAAPAAPATPMTASGVAPDYSLLANPLFSHAEFQAARARGLSESQIASILRITKLSGDSFMDVQDAVLNGNTFAALAEKYNLKLSDVLSPDIEKQQIPAFEAAYATTGVAGLKNDGVIVTPMAAAPAPPADAPKPRRRGRRHGRHSTPADAAPAAPAPDLSAPPAAPPPPADAPPAPAPPPAPAAPPPPDAPAPPAPATP